MSGFDLGTLRRGGISNTFCSGVFSRNMASAGGVAFCLGQILRGKVLNPFGARFRGVGEGHGASSVRRKSFWAFCTKYSWSKPMSVLF